MASTVATQNRGFGGLIFSSPVTSATASAPTRSTARLKTSRANSRSGRPIRPDECASIRSSARWVLPVLVGPSTAVTPAPRARRSRLIEGAKEIGIRGLIYAKNYAKAAASVSQQHAGKSCV